MSIYAAPGATFSAVLDSAPAGLAGTLGVRIERTDGTNQTPRSTAGIVEIEPASGIYVATRTAPGEGGRYVVVWDDGAGTFTSEELTVGLALPGDATPPGGNLTTHEKAELYLARTGGADPEETEDDAFIDILITSYSTAIHRYCKREWMPKTPASDSDPAVTRKFLYDGDGYLNLKPYELRTATSVVLFSDLASSVQRTLQTTEYRLGPRQQSESGTYLYVALPELGCAGSGRVDDLLPLVIPRPNSSFQVEVAITGYWGVGVVPADVELACLIAVANAYQNPEDFASRLQTGGLDATEFTEQEPESLPRASRALLTPYRR